MRTTSEDILHGPIAPVLRKMTLPMVAAIFAMMMFQIVDTYFLSLLGTAELAAISFTFPVTFTLVNLTIGLSIAISVIVGQAIGQGRRNKAARMTTEALLLNAVVVVIVAVAGLLTVDPLFALLGASPATIELIHEYIDIWYLFVALMVLPMICNSAIRATGDTKWPSILMVASGVVNIVFDPLLIFGFGPIPAMGMRGAAWATVISWGVGAVAAFYLLWVREKLLVFSLPPARELLTVWGSTLRLALPISLANMLSPVAIGILTALIAGYGEHAVAAFGVGGRIEAFVLVVAFATTSALSPYMAQNLGAGNLARARRALFIAVRFIIGFQIMLYAVLALLAQPIAGIFSRDPQVIEIAVLYLQVMPLGALGYAVIVIINTAFNAHHRSSRTLALSLLRVFVLVVPLAWLGSRLAGISGLYAGAVVGNTVAAAACWVVYRRLAKDVELAAQPV